ncbi:hypothetical protein V6M85_03155 [Sulfolobus tengchongensis]|uniref:Uncharacterized protein n=1 Tax=Sulfolobus tengchongensis TaxID=207809 RepID=A0AAX4L1Q5_9CREN
MPRRSKNIENKENPPLVINLSNIPKYKHLLISWYVRTALQYLYGFDIFLKSPSQIDINQMVDDINRALEGLKLEKAKNLEYQDFQETYETISKTSYRNFLQEFKEFGRTFGGQTSEIRELNRVQKGVLKLATIGYEISKVKEYNVFVDITSQNVLLKDIRKAMDSLKLVFSAISNNKLSEKALMIGMASAIALAYKDNINDLMNNPLRVIYVSKSGNLVSYVLNELSNELWHLGITSSIFQLLVNYKYEIKNRKNTTIKNFIELLATTIIQYHNLGSINGFYPIIRSLTSDTVVEEGSFVYKEKWDEITKGLLGINLRPKVIVIKGDEDETSSD